MVIDVGPIETIQTVINKPFREVALLPNRAWSTVASVSPGHDHGYYFQSQKELHTFLDDFADTRFGNVLLESRDFFEDEFASGKLADPYVQVGRYMIDLMNVLDPKAIAYEQAVETVVRMADRFQNVRHEGPLFSARRNIHKDMMYSVGAAAADVALSGGNASDFGVFQSAYVSLLEDERNDSGFSSAVEGWMQGLYDQHVARGQAGVGQDPAEWFALPAVHQVLRQSGVLEMYEPE